MFRKFKRRLGMILHSLLPQGKNVQLMHESKTDIVPNLAVNRQNIDERLGSSFDIVFRDFVITIEQRKVPAFILFVKGIVDQGMISDNILKPLMYQTSYSQAGNLLEGMGTIGDLIQNSVLSSGQLKKVHTIEQVVDSVFYGETAIFMSGCHYALIANTQGWETRGVNEPDTESVVRGPREGFSETLLTNTSLLRRRIRNPNLVFESMIIGKQTKTSVCIGYIKGVAKEEIFREVKRRLEKIDTDAVLESGYLEEFIEDTPFTPFSTIGNTEKPDIAAAKMLEGRVCILTDGTPFVLTVPYLLIESFQTSEDYYSRPFYTLLLRWIRYIAYAITILLPGLYVSIASFHQDMVPTPLLLTMAAEREGTPFPAVVEAIGMGLIFEVLREAGVRLPKPVGQAVSIVGALIIGESSVRAGLIGAPMVIMVAFTAITSFVIPAQLDSGAVLRLAYTILAGILGIFGLTAGVLITAAHLVRLRSFGVPYLTPLAPIVISDLKDVLMRAPMWLMWDRPALLSKNTQRQSRTLMPAPSGPDDKEEQT